MSLFYFLIKCKICLCFLSIWTGLQHSLEIFDPAFSQADGLYDLWRSLLVWFMRIHESYSWLFFGLVTYKMQLNTNQVFHLSQHFPFY